MSKSKKLQKVKKPMSPKTKAIIGNSFKGIISNQACVDNGKEAPWWLAILFLLFAIIIPLIPSHVQLSKAYGSSFLSGGNYEADRGLMAMTYKMNEDHVDLVVDNSELNCYINGSKVDSEYHIISYTANHAYTETVGEVKQINYYEEYEFVAIYTKVYGADYQALLNGLRFVQKTKTVYDPDIHLNQDFYVPSFIIFTPYGYQMNMYKISTHTLAASSPTGSNWESYCGSLYTPIINEIDFTQYPTLNDFLTKDFFTNSGKVFSRWANVFNNAYLKTKEKIKWTTTLIYLGVYAGLMFFLGLMVFLLTRGKNNPFRGLNFWVCQKIGYFLSFTPAVLALIIGFIIPTNIIAQMAFIMLVSLRVMWASMRQLRPVY